MREYKQNRKRRVYNKPSLQYVKNGNAILRWIQFGYNTRQDLLKVTNLKHGELSNAISYLVKEDKITREFILGKMRYVRYHLKEVK